MLTMNPIVANAQQVSSKVELSKLATSRPVEHFYSTEVFRKPKSVITKNIESMIPTQGHFKLSQINHTDIFNLIKDNYKMASSKSLQVKALPVIEFDYVVSDNFVIPKQRTVQRSSHPGWEWQISPATGWVEKLDAGYSRIVFPFALQEKNANCTHNGLLMILVNAKGEAGNGLFQIASETCAYFQFDWVGKVSVEYSKLADDSKIKPSVLINNFKNELQSKTKLLNLSDLKTTYPKLNIKKLLPKPLSSSTTSGLVIKGKHYSLNCATRYGEYPYCEWLALPSYSTAKSIFAGIGLMRLQALVPNVEKILVSKMIPECAEDRWQNVTLADLVNMRTGNYISKNPHSDEASSKMMQFFLATSYRQKVDAACNMFPQKGTPGKRFIYHTSDTFLAGIMLNKIFSAVSGKKDFYSVILAGELWPKIKLSPLLDESKRTYDSTQQTFTGWGLTYYVDDIIKISEFLQQQRTATSSNSLLDLKLLNRALITTNNQQNLDGGEKYLSYNYGFWALDVGKSLSCQKSKWIPFMSGFGGITVALISPDLLYYNYADNQRFNWLDVIIELNKQLPICEAI